MAKGKFVLHHCETCKRDLPRRSFNHASSSCRECCRTIRAQYRAANPKMVARSARYREKREAAKHAAESPPAPVYQDTNPFEWRSFRHAGSIKWTS